MPLLMCPNCNLSTQQVRRHDIEIDMCPQCRGVWMDRGELEKILDLERANLAAAAAQAPVPAAAPAHAAPPPGQGPWPDRRWHNDHKPQHDRDRDDYRRYDHDDYKRHKRRSIFDFFDD
jgi:hypothetical protein